MGDREIAHFRNTRVGFVFQDHLLLPQCTVLENVLIPTLVGDPDPGAADRAMQLIEQVGLRESAPTIGRRSCPGANASGRRWRAR